MSRRKYNGCLIWGGSIFSAAVISVLIGVAAIFGAIKIASLQIVRKEEDIQTELKTSLGSITPPANSTLVSSESSMAKDMSCLFIGPFVNVHAYYSANIPPLVVYRNYDRQLKEQGWIFIDTRGTDWNNDKVNMPYLEASYYKTGGYHALLEYAREYSGAPWTYHFLMEWQGSNYPCHSN